MKKNSVYIILVCLLIGVTGCTKSQKKAKNQSGFDRIISLDSHEPLTAANLDSIADEDLEQAVFDNLFEQFKGNYSQRFSKIKQLSKGQQAFWATWVVEGEVNNGGFNQFYFNNKGKFSKMAEVRFQTFGATKHAELMHRANKIYAENKEQLEKFNDGTLERFSESYKDNPLNKLDDEFYELYKVERLSELRIQYIRDHKEEFINQK